MSALQLAYNSKVNMNTGVTPLLAFTGKQREARLLGLPSGHDKLVQDIVDRMRKMYKYIWKLGETESRGMQHYTVGRRMFTRWMNLYGIYVLDQY